MIQTLRRRTEIAYQELYQSVRLRQAPEIIRDELDKYRDARQKLVDYSKGLVEKVEGKK